MALSQNPEFRQLMLIWGALTVLFVLLALAAALFSTWSLRNTAAHTHAAIVGAVAEHYPDAEEDIVRQILQSGPGAAVKGEAVLSRYGVYAGDALVETELMKSSFRANLALYLALAVLAGGSLGYVTVRFAGKQYGRVNEITRYAAKIKGGDYSLDIRDNREGYISILKNEIYKITTMLKEQAEALQHDKLALADSIADISHQLKTPMTAMFVLTDLLSEEPSPRVKEEFLERMKSQLKRIDWLVSSLLTLSRLDAGTLTLKRESVRVRELVDKVIEMMSVPLDIKMIRVSVEGDDGALFQGDFSWSREALINILKNCIEHTPEKGFIEISFAENPLYTVITIADSGIGIDKADLPYIFNRFYKGKNAGSDSVGIGLAMAQAIAAKQGGEITVQSDKGSGAAFTIKFYKEATSPHSS